MTNDQDMERLLGRYQPARPDADLRGRVLASATSRADRRVGLFWWAMAASLLIGAALAQISASATTFVEQHRPDAQAVRHLAAEIREVAPDVSEEEAGILSLHLASANGLIAIPRVPSRTAPPSMGEQP